MKEQQCFSGIAAGAKVAIMVGGNRQVRAEGTVQSVTAARFKVSFPAYPEAAIYEPFGVTFRKADGRSVATSSRHFAQQVEQ